MKHYITGASGFIGQHMVGYLQDAGHRVLPFPRREPISWPISWLLTKLEDFVLVHLAAYGNHSTQTDPEEIIKANIIDLTTILSVLAKSTCVKFYNVSTSAIQLPKQTLYSASKLFGELLVEAAQDPRFVNVRPFSVFGPGEATHRFIPTVIRALHSGETITLDPWAVHDWIYVTDFIDAMFKGYTDIGTGLMWTNFEIVQMLERIAGKKLNYQVGSLRKYDTRCWGCDNPVPYGVLEDQLKETYEYFIQKDFRAKQKA